MVLDTSAVVAIIRKEAESKMFASAIENAPLCLLSAGSLLEASIVLETALGPEGVREMDAFIASAAVEVQAFDAEQAIIAREAYHRFGKGHHPAALNLGDCFAYALAMATGYPLLYKGNDFEKTDVASAAPAE